MQYLPFLKHTYTKPVNISTCQLHHHKYTFQYRILSEIRACASNVRLKKDGHVLITGCISPLSYTKFETETRPKQGDALITEGARISERIR